MEVLYETNPYQTQITKDLLKDYPDEVVESFWEFIGSVEYIKRMISPNRPFAKDMPKDKDGKIIVDISNIHILTDMDYFREMAIHFQKHGCYTFLRPNLNPNSEFGKLFSREIHRILNGMVRPEDGEWITGDMYFYLNYAPIIKSVPVPGTKIAERVVDFPDPWEGVYMWFHYLHQARYGGLYNDFQGGQHGVQIAKRGASKSYSCGSMLARLLLVGESEHTTKNIRAVISAYATTSLTGDGTLNKFEDMIDHCAEYTQLPRLRLRSSMKDMYWEMGYRINGKPGKFGSGNTVIGVAQKDDVDKSRGKRAVKMIYEEFGAFKNFLDVWRINQQSSEQGNYSFGQAIAIGTGGTEGSNFYGALEMIQSPEGYNVYALPDIYNKNSNPNNKTVFFFSTLINRLGRYNKDGVSDIIGALLDVLMERFQIKYKTQDQSQLPRGMAENPITIREAIMKRESVIYPTTHINQRLDQIDNDISFFDSIEEVDLVMQGSKVVPVPSKEKPIRNFPHKDNSQIGCIEIHEHPRVGPEGNIPRGRYIAGIDTYDDDSSGTLSLGSIYILDLWTDDIVAEYTGRPLRADDFYEICRLMLLYYNAEGNYENNKKGLFTYFSKMNSTYLLSDVLEYLKGKDDDGRRYSGNKAKGTTASTPVNEYARERIREYLIQKSIGLTIDENGEKQEVDQYKLYTMRSYTLLEELSLFTIEGNYDRHDAFAMLMLLREDKLRLSKGKDPREAQEQVVEEDSFFARNYDNRFSN